MGAKRLPNDVNDEGGPWFVSGNGLGWCPSDSRAVLSDFGRPGSNLDQPELAKSIPTVMENYTYAGFDFVKFSKSKSP